MTTRHFSTPLFRLWQGVSHAMQMRASRHALAQLDDRMLADLGISRAQAAFEAERGGVWDHLQPYRRG